MDKHVTISLDQAIALAEKTVRALGASNDDEFDIIQNETIETGEGWIFFYDSREFIETRKFSSRLAGNGPIFVARSGIVKILPSAVPWEEAIRGACSP